MDNDTRLIEILKKASIIPSPQRVAIYKELYFNKNHPSADEIYQKVLLSLPTISLTTIYNTLERFVQAKLVVPILVQNSPVRYDAVELQNRHDHFYCLYCRDIYDIPYLTESLPPELVNRGFIIEEQSSIVFGYCPNCHKASDHSKNSKRTVT